MRGLLIVALLALSSPAWGSTVPPDSAGNSATPVDSLMMDIGEVLDDLLTPQPYFYQSAGMRDPFQSLLDAEGTSSDGGGYGVEDLIVVGILWAERDRFALVETHRGHHLILRQGDPIRNGRVIEVLLDGLKVRYSHYGVVRTVTLSVESGAEEKDER